VSPGDERKGRLEKKCNKEGKGGKEAQGPVLDGTGRGKKPSFCKHAPVRQGRWGETSVPGPLKGQGELGLRKQNLRPTSLTREGQRKV